MTPRWDAYLSATANRDLAFSQLALIAFVIVTAWVLVDLLPENVRPWLRRVYLIGGIVLYAVTFAVSVGGLYVK